MSEKMQIEDPTGEGNPVPEIAPEPAKTFSQSDVDDIVKKRLAEEKSRQARAEAEAKRIAALEGEDRVRAEYESKIKTMEEQYAEVIRQLAVTRAEAKLSAIGLPSSLAVNLIGANDEETDRNIAEFSKSVNSLVAVKVNEGLKKGTPPAGGVPASRNADAEAEIRRAMGL